MSAAIKQIVTLRAGGVVEVQSPQLHEGDQAEVTVIVRQLPANDHAVTETGGWRRFAGAVNGGDPRARDNERIDADLAAEYGNSPKASIVMV